MRSERVAALLDQLIETAGHIVDFVRDMSLEEFVADVKTRQAVVMGLVVVSELLTKIAVENPRLRDEFPEIPWTAIRGLRNRIAHDYFTINLTTVFETAKRGIPELLASLKRANLG